MSSVDSLLIILIMSSFAASQNTTMSTDGMLMTDVTSFVPLTVVDGTITATATMIELSPSPTIMSGVTAAPNLTSILTTNSLSPMGVTNVSNTPTHTPLVTTMLSSTGVITPSLGASSSADINVSTTVTQSPLVTTMLSSTGAINPSLGVSSSADINVSTTVTQSPLVTTMLSSTGAINPSLGASSSVDINVSTTVTQSPLVTTMLSSTGAITPSLGASSSADVNVSSTLTQTPLVTTILSSTESVTATVETSSAQVTNSMSVAELTISSAPLNPTSSFIMNTPTSVITVIQPSSSLVATSLISSVGATGTFSLEVVTTSVVASSTIGIAPTGTLVPMATESSPSSPTTTFISTSGPISSSVIGTTPTPGLMDDSVLPFLSFNDQKKQLIRYLDGVSDTIYIPNGFPFGLQTHTLAYVGTNGVISFSRPFYYWWPSPFPGFYYLRRFHVVAPYWSDHDIRREGEVSYEIFEKGRSSYDDMLLDRVNDYLTANAMTNFSGTFMILAEWRDVHPYPHGSGSLNYFEIFYPSIRDFTNQVNTYQAVVITDGSESYTVFTYMCDLMKWSGLYNYPTIGFNAAGTLFANHPLTGREEANNIDCIGDNQQYNNVWYKLSVDPDLVERLRRQCLSWYFSDIESYGSSVSVTDFSKSQNACPCSWLQARWDRRYWFFTSKDDSFCYIERFPNALGGAQECCYSRSSNSFGALVLQGRSSGGLLRYHPYWSWIINYPNYILYDRNAQEICCLSSVGYCRFYHERRPPNDCTGYVPQRRTWGWGDPHITTLDGRRYTFNGWGEYVLLRTTSSDFEFQGRTEPAVNSNATIFSAFVLREGNDTVEVGINNTVGDDLFAIKLNSMDVSDDLTSVGDNITSSSAFVEKSSNNSISVSFPSGVGITINVTAGLLVYTLEVPPSLEGTTSGLLGNYNGDDSDEFAYRNGTMISNSSSDSMIHQFGQSWQLTDPESLFTYGPDESVANYSFPGHVPPFLDEILSNLTANSSLVDVCGDNVECLFDFGQTGDPDVGMAAMMVENQTAIEMQDSSSFPPNITAPEIFLATVGEDSVYTFTVTSDNDNINVMVLHDGEDMLPDGVVVNDLDGDSYSITWTADNSTVLNLTIVANDPSNENVSSMFIPTVQLCACENGGNCTTNGLLNTDFSFVVLNCVCPAGYDGEFCQNDADGCDIVSCLEGQQCFDYPAPLVGAECSCPSGYAAGNDSKCVDIDECANSSNNVCTQQCVNTPGSYQCDCYDGYQPIDVNATQCEDIDECMEYNDCHQICTNTEGSYECSCDPGFVLMADNRTCEAEVNCSSNTCEQECAIIDGNATCFCQPGYKVDLVNITECTDIDECAENGTCDQNCTNTDGSFNCSCYSGYELVGRNCDDIDECLTDIDECLTNMICINTDGGYNCSCPQGTIRNGSNCDLEIIAPISRVFTTPSPTTSIPTSSLVSPSPTPSTTVFPSDDDDDLSTGAIIGIVIGVIAGVVILTVISVMVVIGKSRGGRSSKVHTFPVGENLIKKNKAADIEMETISNGAGDP